MKEVEKETRRCQGKAGGGFRAKEKDELVEEEQWVVVELEL